MLTRWGDFVARRARLVLATGVLVVIAAAGFGFGVFDKLQDGGFDDPASESAKATDLEQSAFGNREADLVAIYSSDDMTVSDPAFERAVDDVVAGIPADAVTHVVTWYDTGAPSLVSADRHSTQVVVSLAGDTQDELSTSADEVRPPAPIRIGLPLRFSNLSWPTPGCEMMTCGSFWKIAEITRNGRFSLA